MFEALKQEVVYANLDLIKYRLVIYTWRNRSAIDRTTGLVAINPSGVSYKNMKTKDMVVLDGVVHPPTLLTYTTTWTQTEIGNILNYIYA